MRGLHQRHSHFLIFNVADLMVILDNSTRWNSTYLSLQRALQLRNRIDVYCFEYRENLYEDTLSDGEWHQIREIVKGLHPFYEVTQQLQSNAQHSRHGAIWEAIPALSVLLEQMEQGVQRYSTAKVPAQSTRQQTQSQVSSKPDPLAIAYQNAWQKLRKYYELTDMAHGIYGAAVLLHPSHRKRFFDYHWVDDEVYWKDKMIAYVKGVWEDEYATQSIVPIAVDATLPHEPTLLDSYLRTPDIHAEYDNEFDSFIHGERTPFNKGDHNAVIAWVLDPENPYPGLRQLQLDLLSIPAMSTELERVFSQAKLTITPTRNRLSDETIESVELLRHWWTGNVVSQQRGGGGRQYRKRKAMVVDDDDEGNYDNDFIAN
jgi:hypothetical protein